jgi:hypothetical protein
VGQVAERLAPWLSVANGTSKPPLVFKGMGFDLPSIYFEPLERSVRASLERIILLAEVMRTHDPDWIERYRRAGVVSPPVHVSLVWKAEDGGFWGDLAVGFDGRLTDNPGNLRALFIDALRGAELLRFNRCPGCARFFYRTRNDRYGGLGCSKPCNNALRQSRWRSKQEFYEQTRKYKLAGVRPEGNKR